MSRHWLTSTTALALVLNAAGPLPSAAYEQASVERAAPPIAIDNRLAENENSPAAQGVVSDALGAAPATQTGEQSTTGTIAAEAEAARAAVEEAARQEAEAAAQAEAEAAEKAQAEADQTQAEADAAAKAQADATAQAEADAAAQKEADEAAQADAEAAQDEAEAAQAKAEADAAQAEKDATAQAEADAAAKAKADAALQAEADEATKAQADAAAKAEADQAAKTEADRAAKAAEDAAEKAPAQSDEAATSPATGEAQRSESTENNASEPIPEISAADQASAAERADESAAAAAAASGEGEVVDTQEMTVTEENSRASSEEFATSASGQQAPAAQAVVPDDGDDNELLKNLGVAAAAGLGAYAIGRMLNGGGQVVSNTGDRVVVQEPSGAYRLIKDDDTLLRRPGSDVQTQTYSDGSTRSTVTEADGSSTVTIRSADGRVLSRTRVLNNGQEVVLFDDTKSFARVDVTDLERANADAAARNYDYSTSDVDQLRMALNSANGQTTGRTYSLNQIRQITAVRHLVPVIALDAINFKTGSAVIEANEAQALSELGRAMVGAIDENPAQVFLIEGHTDTVGDASYNLALSDRRAESVALALTEYFDVPPANMIVQGYGESDLRTAQQGDIRANRRAAVRNITPLLGNGR